MKHLTKNACKDFSTRKPLEKPDRAWDNTQQTLPSLMHWELEVHQDFGCSWAFYGHWILGTTAANNTEVRGHGDRQLAVIATHCTPQNSDKQEKAAVKKKKKKLQKQSLSAEFLYMNFQRFLLPPLVQFYIQSCLSLSFCSCLSQKAIEKFRTITGIWTMNICKVWRRLNWHFQRQGLCLLYFFVCFALQGYFSDGTIVQYAQKCKLLHGLVWKSSSSFPSGIIPALVLYLFVHMPLLENAFLLKN